MNQYRRAEGLALGLARGPCPDQTSTRFGFGVGSRPPVSSRRSLSCSCLLFCFFDPCRPGGCNVWLGLARGFLLGGYQALSQLRRAEGLALGLARGPCPDQTSTRFGFGVGSRPPVSSRRSLSCSCLLFCFFDPCRPGGCNVWLGLARGFLLGGYQALNQLRRAEGLALGLARGPQFPLNA